MKKKETKAKAVESEETMMVEFGDPEINVKYLSDAFMKSLSGLKKSKFSFNFEVAER